MLFLQDLDGLFVLFTLDQVVLELFLQLAYFTLLFYALSFLVVVLFHQLVQDYHVLVRLVQFVAQIVIQHDVESVADFFIFIFLLGILFVLLLNSNLLDSQLFLEKGPVLSQEVHFLFQEPVDFSLFPEFPLNSNEFKLIDRHLLDLAVQLALHVRLGLELLSHEMQTILEHVELLFVAMGHD